MNRQPDLEPLRLAVYRAFAEDGRAPRNDVLAQQLGTDPAGIEAGLRALAAARHLALDTDGRIVLAHPFASIPLGFSVMGTRTLWWGGCAWDAFALPQLVISEPDVLVATRVLPATGRWRGSWAGTGPRLVPRSPTSWCRWRTSGTTWCAPVATSASSVTSAAWTPG